MTDKPIKEPVTTLQLPVKDRVRVKAIADARGLKVKYAAGVLAEAWDLLTNEQIAVACERYFTRRPRRREPAKAAG